MCGLTGFRLRLPMKPIAHEAVRTTHDAEETRALGENLARRLRPGDVVLLYGELGSGKTTLAQGIIHGLQVDAWASSPSFTIINEYDGRLWDDRGTSIRIYHCDFYRLSDPGELDSLALDEVFCGSAVALVEWPEIAEAWVPNGATRVTIARRGAEDREITVSG